MTFSGRVCLFSEAAFACTKAENTFTNSLAVLLKVLCFLQGGPLSVSSSVGASASLRLHDPLLYQEVNCKRKEVEYQ